MTQVKATGAEQAAVAPPFAPAQDHAQGPLPATGVAVPVEHRLAGGALVNTGVLVTAVPCALPHEPFTIKSLTVTVLVPVALVYVDALAGLGV